MRFAAPSSVASSSVRRIPQKGVTFGVPLDSDSSEEESESASDSDSDSDSFCYASESEVPPPTPDRKPRMPRTDAERRRIDDAVASIRLRTRHHDVYEEWEKETRKDALRTARRERAEVQDAWRAAQAQARAERLTRVLASHKRATDQVAAQLRGLDERRALEAERMREHGRARDAQLWERIEAVIRVEEERARQRVEEERLRREAEERRRREEVERKLAEERRQAEEAARKQAEEDERRKREEAEEEEKKRLEEAEHAQAEMAQSEERERRALGLTTADDDWRRARGTLMRLKAGSMKTVKGNRETKSVWSALRRQITPKIGQLTNDEQSINLISEQIFNILRPNPPLPDDIYAAALSSLAKAILLQAETEVTAEKRSARPLAAVAANLLMALPNFADVLWAKMCQRAGGWPVPAAVPALDIDGAPFDADARRKAMGYRPTEGAVEYAGRVAGIMRVYFEIVRASPNAREPLDPMFRMPRLWFWMARMLGAPRMMMASVAPQLIHVALDVLGADAKVVWGRQWIKILALLYESVTVGIGGDLRLVVGGESAEGKAGRVRVQLEIERIMGVSP